MQVSALEEVALHQQSIEKIELLGHVSFTHAPRLLTSQLIIFVSGLPQSEDPLPAKQLDRQATESSQTQEP